MTNKYDNVKYDKDTAVKYDFYKQKFIEMDACIDLLQGGRAKSLVVTHLETAHMWLNKALRDEQVTKNSLKELNSEGKHG